ncbi:hypothetical protein J3E69DRAFT_159944 [Trichoderma sp. SZMC 28015]
MSFLFPFIFLFFFSAWYISFASDSQVLIRMLRTTLPNAVMNKRNCDALQDDPHSVIMMQPRLAVLGGLSAARRRGLRASQRPIRLDVLGLEALQMPHTARLLFSHKYV